MGPTLQGTSDTYETQRKIGEGGFGETFLATAKSDGRSVVLKRLRIDRLDDLKALELFEREAGVLATLDHPNIPRYIDAFPEADGGGLVLAQEYVEGKTLRASLRAGEEIDEAVMTRWFLQMLEVCDYLHALDPPVIHRDVNPNNIILRDTDTEPFLIDFGTVQAAIVSESVISSTAAGTFGYAPTEQFIGKAYPSSDLYGLGMTFLAVWTGMEPEEMPFADGEVELNALLAKRPLDGRLKLAIEGMIDRVPEKRPERAGEVLARLAPLRDKPRVHAVKNVVNIQGTKPSGTDESCKPWRDAKARLDRLETHALLGEVSPGFAHASVGNWALSANGTQMVFLADGRAVLVDTSTMAITTKLKGNDGDDAVGFAPDESFIVAFNGWDERMTRFDLPGGKASKFPIPEELQSSSYDGLDAPIAISPDGKLAALGSPLALFDPSSGALIRVTDIESEARPCFSPDGRTLVGQRDNTVVMMSTEGSRREVKGTCLAFSPDGRRVAVGAEGRKGFKINTGPWEKLETSSNSWSDRSYGLPLPKGSEIRHLAFDPTGRWLAIGASVKHTPPATPADWTWGNRVLVLDTEDGAIVGEVNDPSRGGNALGGLYAVAFDPASTRLFVLTKCYPSAQSKDDQYALLVHDLHANRLLAVVNADGARTPEGFFSPLPSERPPKKPEKGPYAGLALRAACGNAREDELPDAAREALLDLRQRIEFLKELFRGADESHGIALPYETDLGPLIKATKGLTHMLPWIVDDARERAAAVPAFGAAPGAAPSVRIDHLMAAATSLLGRGESERDALFEEMLERIAAQTAQDEARERDKAAQAKRSEAAAAERRARAAALARPACGDLESATGRDSKLVRMRMAVGVVFFGAMLIALILRLLA